tara:strand:+ start:333 stop:506 length:174 start_codon:yes stop_codon:yes gene_type:complete
MKNILIERIAELRNESILIESQHDNFILKAEFSELEELEEIKNELEEIERNFWELQA